MPVDNLALLNAQAGPVNCNLLQHHGIIDLRDNG